MHAGISDIVIGAGDRSPTPPPWLMWMCVCVTNTIYLYRATAAGIGVWPCNNWWNEVSMSRSAAFVSASASCSCVRTCLTCMMRKAMASRTKCARRWWCRALRLGGRVAVPMAARESDHIRVGGERGPVAVVTGHICDTLVPRGTGAYAYTRIVV